MSAPSEVIMDMNRVWQIVRAMKSSKQRDQLFVLMCACTGSTMGRVLSLTISDLDSLPMPEEIHLFWQGYKLSLVNPKSEDLVFQSRKGTRKGVKISQSIGRIQAWRIISDALKPFNLQGGISLLQDVKSTIEKAEADVTPTSGSSKPL